MSRAEAFDILGDCLGLHFGTGHLTGTRLKLYAQPGLWTPLFELAHASGLLPALESAVSPQSRGSRR